MEICKTGQNTIIESAREILKETIKEVPEGTIEWEDTIMESFSNIVHLGDTGALSLFAAICMTALDKEAYDSFKEAVAIMSDQTAIMNTISYTLFNKIEET